MAELKLSCGRVTLVDDADLPSLLGVNWRGHTSRGKTYVRAKIARAAVQLHRFLMAPPPDMVVDHINGDTLDNRRSNLRVCTVAQNSRNKSGWSGRRFKGVYERQGRWRAIVMKDGKQLQAGAFASPIEAAVAYDIAAREAYGEYARPNFSPARDWLFPYAIADKAGRVSA